jgi:hypothetical protein
MAADLNAKQRRFIEEYLVDSNGARAAITAGYGRAGAAVAAHRLLSNANVQTVLQARQAADAARLQISRERVVAGLLEAVERGRAQQQPMAMVAALREIGRLMGFYAPDQHRVQLAALRNERAAQVMSSLSDQDLLAMIDSDGVSH